MRTVTITTVRPRTRPWRRVRGILAVAALLLSAAEALISAVTGWRPVSLVVREFGAVFAATWRSATRRPAPAGPLVTIRTPTPPGPANDGSQ